MSSNRRVTIGRESPRRLGEFDRDIVRRRPLSDARHHGYARATRTIRSKRASRSRVVLARRRLARPLARRASSLARTMRAVAIEAVDRGDARACGARGFVRRRGAETCGFARGVVASMASRSAVSTTAFATYVPRKVRRSPKRSGGGRATRSRGTDRDVFTTAAVQQDFQGEEDFGEEGEAKPPASPMDPYAYGQQDSVRLLSGFLTARDSTRPARAPVRAHLFPIRVEREY